MKIETEQQAVAYMSEKVRQAYAALQEAESVADQFNLSFSFEPVYGMGGWYDGDRGEWNSSSSSC